MFNHELEGYYVEHEVCELTQQVIEQHILKYNEGGTRRPLSLVLYRYFNEQLLKMHRIMKIRHSHLLVVA